MIKIALSISGLFFIAGCASGVNTNPIVTCQNGCGTLATKDQVATTNNSNEDLIVTETPVKSNNPTADGAGQVVGSTTKMVWDSTKKMYVYLSSKETKEKASRAWDSVKKTTSDVKDGIVKGFNQ